MKNEIGMLICRSKDGRLHPGPIYEGNKSSVRVPINCPAGSKPAALWHTHPSGSVQLSDTDIDTGKKFNLPFVCASTGKQGSTRCYRIRK